MANVIKHKRGSGSDPVANDLVVGEVAIRTDTGKLFTKMDNGSVAEIAGGGSDIAINTLSSSSGTGGGSATFNGSAYRFTLSSPPSVSAQQLLVSINGVIQKPVAGTGQPSEGFSVDGTDIILGDAPATGSDFFILTFRSLGVSEPAANSVTNAKVASNAAIAGSKISPIFTSATEVQNSIFKITDSNPEILLAVPGGGLDSRIINDGSGNLIIGHGVNSNTPTERLRIKSDGTVGIGTSDFTTVGSPDKNFVVGSTTNAQEVATTLNVIEGNNNRRVKFFLDDDDGVFGIDSTASTGVAPFVVRMAQSEKIRIDQNGKVMIGTTTEGHASADNLTIADSGNAGITIRSGTTSNGCIFFSDATSGDAEFDGFVQYNHGTDPFMQFGVGDDTRMVIKGSNVGIGTTSPNAPLVVRDASGPHTVFRVNSQSESTKAFIQTVQDSDLRIGSESNHPLNLYTNGNARLHISNDGDVGIGTTSPGGNRLKVQLTDDNSDSFLVKGGSGQGRTNIAVEAGNTDGASSTGIKLVNSGGTTISSIFIMNNADDVNIMNQSQGGEIIFHTSTTANSLGSIHRARFNMGGDFLLGKSSSDINDTGVELKQNGQSKFTRNGGGVAAFNRNTNNGNCVSLQRSGTQVGSINVTTSSTSYNSGTSDRSVKKNFESWTENTLNLFKNINPQKFNYTHEDDGEEKTKGYIAQDLVNSFPEAYPKNDDDIYMFNPSGMVVYLMKAIQELTAKVEALEAK